MKANHLAIVPDSKGPSLVVDTDHLRRYRGNGPRYTSYPAADRFVEEFSCEACERWLGTRTIGGFARPLDYMFTSPPATSCAAARAWFDD